MESISTIGLDIAKSVFQVHAISEAGEVVVRRQLKRRQVLQFFAGLKPCLVGMEACATAHHWARRVTICPAGPPKLKKPILSHTLSAAPRDGSVGTATGTPSVRSTRKKAL